VDVTDVEMLVGLFKFGDPKIIPEEAK